MTTEFRHNGERTRSNTAAVFQFRLSTLLAAVGICSALFAVMVAIGPIGSIVLLFIAIMIGAHVAGAVIGLRLRDETCRQEPARDSDGSLRRAEEPVGG